MGKVTFRMTTEEELAIKQKASSLGFTVSAYIRHLLQESFQKNQAEEKHEKVLTAIRNIVVVLGDAFGRRYKLVT